MKKSLGKKYPLRNHPDTKREKLARRRMKKGSGKYDPSVEVYLRVGSRTQILIRGLLMPWKWKLGFQSPGGPVKKWQTELEQKRGKIRFMVLESNPIRDRDLKRL